MGRRDCEGDKGMENTPTTGQVPPKGVGQRRGNFDGMIGVGSLFPSFGRRREKKYVGNL